MRLTIRKHNQTFINRISAQMECEPTEALNYLLVELNRIKFSFNSSVSLGVNSSPVQLPVLENSEIQEPGQLAQSGLSYVADPDISRLMALGLDEF